MKYTREISKNGKKAFRFEPPQDALDAGVVTRQTFYDGRRARFEIPKLIERVEAFRHGDIVAGNIGPSSTVRQVCAYYFNSSQFRNLSARSQKTYENKLILVMDTPYRSSTLGDVKIKNINPMICAEVYDHWCKDTIAKANEYSRLFSVLLNYCRSLDLLQSNPMSKVKKQQHKPRNIIWTRDQVELFLDTAFSQWRWRNIGMLAYMCYDWAQRPNDIRLLKWSSLNLDEQMVTITQTKRGATVYLPITDELTQMLRQQEEDWGFQEYVVPLQTARVGSYRPIGDTQVSTLAGEVKAACGLPSELQIGHLRKSGIVEMIDAGVDSLQIMSVTGHKDIQSLNPYHKHTYKAAKSALEMRRKA